MDKEEYINAITEMLKNCDADSTLEFIYVLLRKIA